LRRVEEGVAELAKRLDWGAGSGIRSRYDQLVRPLTSKESSEIKTWAMAAWGITVGMLDLSELLDEWYGKLVVAAAAAARSAFPKVTAEAHRKQAAEFIRRLDQLCTDERIAWAFPSTEPAECTLPDQGEREANAEGEQDTTAQCERQIKSWLH
jgi:hypothetical protein